MGFGMVGAYVQQQRRLRMQQRLAVFSHKVWCMKCCYAFLFSPSPLLGGLGTGEGACLCASVGVGSRWMVLKSSSWTTLQGQERKGTSVQ